MRIIAVAFFAAACGTVPLTVRLVLPPPGAPYSVNGNITTFPSTGVIVDAKDGSPVCPRTNLYVYSASDYRDPVDMPLTTVTPKAKPPVGGTYSANERLCIATADLPPGDYWVVAEYPMSSSSTPPVTYWQWGPHIELYPTCIGAGVQPVHVQASPAPSPLELHLGPAKCRPKPVDPHPIFSTSVELSPAIASTQEYCPTAVLKGDREFDGHGPDIDVRVSLEVRADGSAIDARLTMHAVEVGGDGSETQGEWVLPGVYTAPAKPNGTPARITGIDGQKESYTHVRSTSAGFQVIFPGGTNDVSTPPVQGGAFVKEFHIVGDTGGADISTDDNCSDDTRFSVVFGNVRALVQY